MVRAVVGAVAAVVPVMAAVVGAMSAVMLYMLMLAADVVRRVIAAVAGLRGGRSDSRRDCGDCEEMRGTVGSHHGFLSERSWATHDASARVQDSMGHWSLDRRPYGLVDLAADRRGGGTAEADPGPDRVARA